MEAMAFLGMEGVCCEKISTPWARILRVSSCSAALRKTESSTCLAPALLAVAP